MAAKNKVGKQNAKPINQSKDWREHFKHMKTKYVVLASISFVLLIVLNILIFSSSTRTEADLPVLTSEYAKTIDLQEKFIAPDSTSLTNETTSITGVVLQDSMGEVGKAMVRWMDLIVLLIVLGFIVGFITQMSRRFT